jgi:glycine oxidase
LSIALALHGCGARVTVVERGKVLSEASQAAAGMLAAEDPDNPPQMAALARLSADRYADFLGRIEDLAGVSVPFQTSVTYQGIKPSAACSTPDLPLGILSGKTTFSRLAEHSIDPRQLATALRGAVEATSIRLLEDTSVRTVIESSDEMTIQTSGETTNGETIRADRVVMAMGAWSFSPVTPRKGQMLAVQMPAGAEIDYVLRTHSIYVVPRLQGQRAGQVVIGATVEDAGFAKDTDAASLAALRARAAAYLPALAAAPTVDQWAGLRPHTPDLLPLIGWAGDSQRKIIATGHYRNGILLAPGTAAVVTRLLEGREPEVDLAAFSPKRFSEKPFSHT